MSEHRDPQKLTFVEDETVAPVLVNGTELRVILLGSAQPKLVQTSQIGADPLAAQVEMASQVRRLRSAVAAEAPKNTAPILKTFVVAPGQETICLGRSHNEVLN